MDLAYHDNVHQYAPTCTYGNLRLPRTIYDTVGSNIVHIGFGFTFNTLCLVENEIKRCSAEIAGITGHGNAAAPSGPSPPGPSILGVVNTMSLATLEKNVGFVQHCDRML